MLACSTMHMTKLHDTELLQSMWRYAVLQIAQYTLSLPNHLP